MNIIRVKHSSKRKSPTFWRRAKKSPTFWDADLDRKSRAFRNDVKKNQLFGW